MAYAHKFLKVTFGGETYGGEDTWTCGLSIGNETEDFNWTLQDLEGTVTDNIVGDLKDWFQRPASGISPAASLNWVKFALIGTDGKYASTETGAYDYNEIHDFPGVVGGITYSDARYVAPQLTVALTMETDVRRGAGRYGRIYPPLTGTVNSNGRDMEPQAKAQSFKTLLDDINNNFNTFANMFNETGVIVASNVGSGRNSRVKSVKVGEVIDTQRRRRNEMAENYTTLTLA